RHRPRPAPCRRPPPRHAPRRLDRYRRDDVASRETRPRHHRPPRLPRRLPDSYCYRNPRQPASTIDPGLPAQRYAAPVPVVSHCPCPTARGGRHRPVGNYPTPIQALFDAVLGMTEPDARAKLIAAAECLFAQGGEEATSLRAITREAGVNVA